MRVDDRRQSYLGRRRAHRQREPEVSHDQRRLELLEQRQFLGDVPFQRSAIVDAFARR